MMENVLLINTSFPRTARKYSAFGPPLGILAIASALAEAGYEVTLIDPQLEEDYPGRIDEALRHGPLFVGMSSYFGCNLRNGVELAARVKSASASTPLVWGGPLASALPEVCIEQAQVDYVVRGPGESVVVELAAALQNGDRKALQAHPHIAMRLPDGRIKQGENFVFDGNLDELPRIDLSFWKEGVARLGFVPMITSRGCPRQCSFCYNTFTGKGKYMLRSAESVLAEMQHLHEMTQCGHFMFMDDNFLIDEDRAMTIIEAAKANNWEITRLYAHLTDFRPRVLQEICDQRIQTTMCIESGSRRIRRILRKGLNIDRALALIEELALARVPFITAFMFGIPSETDWDIRQSIEVAARIRTIMSDKATIMFYLYAPQSGDQIVAEHGWRDKIEFSLDALSTVEMVPVPPDDKIDLRLRPWMDDSDAAFYRALAQVWFYYFSRDFRNRNPAFSPDRFFSRNRRLAALFEGIEAPVSEAEVCYA